MKRLEYEKRELADLRRVASIEEKKEDVIKLNEYYLKWSELFKTNRHKDAILNLLIDEVNKEDLDSLK